MVLMLIVSVGGVERRKEKDKRRGKHTSFCVYGEVFTCPTTFSTLLLFVINLVTRKTAEFIVRHCPQFSFLTSFVLAFPLSSGVALRCVLQG